MELKITKERILDAASKCSTAKATLKVLFPEAFEDEQIYLSIKLTVREGGNFDGKAWALYCFDNNGKPIKWQLLDDGKYQVLVCDNPKYASKVHSPSNS